MCDTFRPLFPTEAALDLDDPAYPASWEGEHFPMAAGHHHEDGSHRNGVAHANGTSKSTGRSRKPATASKKAAKPVKAAKTSAKRGTRGRAVKRG